MINHMLTKEEVAKRLKDRNINKVSRKVGLSLPTIYNIANGGSGNYETVKILSDYLENNP